MGIRLKYRAYAVDSKGMMEQPRHYWDDIKYSDTDTMEEMLKQLKEGKEYGEILIIPVANYYLD